MSKAGKVWMPSRIVTRSGSRPLLVKATATEIREYIRSLNREHRERTAGLHSVLKRLTKYTAHERSITIAELEAREARENG